MVTLEQIERRINYLTYLPVALAPLSLAGSALTLYVVRRISLGGTYLTTYHRLLIGICVFDLMFSSALYGTPCRCRSCFGISESREPEGRKEPALRKRFSLLWECLLSSIP